MLCCTLVYVFVFFFFKQKTAYEMRISDWSSDVCSSDLDEGGAHPHPRRAEAVARHLRDRLEVAGVGAAGRPRLAGRGEAPVLPRPLIESFRSPSRLYAGSLGPGVHDTSALQPEGGMFAVPGPVALIGAAPPRRNPQPPGSL